MTQMDWIIADNIAQQSASSLVPEGPVLLTHSSTQTFYIYNVRTCVVVFCGGYQKESRQKEKAFYAVCGVYFCVIISVFDVKI